RKMALLLLLVLPMVFGGCVAENKTEVSTTEVISGVVEDNAADTEDTGEKVWTERDVRQLFADKQANDESIIECVVADDGAYERVGVVLFAKEDDEVSYLGFMNDEGYYAVCGTYAKLADEPELTYLGDGVVTFGVQTDEGKPYLVKVSYSRSDDGLYTNFVMEDLPQE
ncbi:MAG: hypothetical protein IJE29_03320, partial [Firmicutes bacterium]|nr:hypothetical protein [Bacillota bacterium]